MSNKNLYNFNIEGVTFIAGLFWQPLSGNNASKRKSEIKSLANEMQFDLHILSGADSSFTVGFAKSNGVAKSGFVSIASVISKHIETVTGSKDFIFSAPLEDGKWLFVSQRDGIILPDGDLVFPNEDGAKARTLQDSRLADWKTIVCPSIWGIKNSIEKTLEESITRKSNGKIQTPKESKLTRINTNGFIGGNKVLLLSLSGLVMAGMYGYNYKLELDREKALEAQRAMLAAQESNDQLQPAIPNPWKSKRLPSDLLASCQAALNQVRLFPGNWSLTNVHCTDSLLTITWAPKTGGWIKHLQEIEPKIVIAYDGASASLTLPLSEGVNFSDEALTDSNQRLLDMYSAAQRYGVKFSAKPPPPPPAALPGQETAVIPKWGEITWKADEVKFPEVVIKAFEGNGMRLSSMDAVWQNGSLIWTMEGIQYVKS